MSLTSLQEEAATLSVLPIEGTKLRRDRQTCIVIVVHTFLVIRMSANHLVCGIDVSEYPFVVMCGVYTF